MSESDEDTPTLSADTLAALQMFYSEQSLQHQKAQMAYELGNVTNINIQEDWQLSQFWYTENTATRLAQEALAVARPDGRIACLSSPTAYKTIKSLCPEGCLVKCLEYDTRFSIYGDDFQFFDYKDPLNLPLEWKHSFDVVIVDPPFLSEECLCRMAVTAKFLTKDKIILCTGMVMEAMAEKLLGAKLCTFIPRHTNQLQNEFRCYTNYDAIHLNDT